MPTLRSTCVFVTSLILVLSASANVDAVTTPIPTVTFTCCGDCNGDGVVTQDELQTCVPPIIPEAPFSPCPACDCNHDGNVGSAGELTQIVTNILNGCPGAPTKTASAPSTPTVAPTVTPTSTACAGEPPQVNPVTSPTDLLQQTITGFGRPLIDSGGSHTIYVITPAGGFSAYTSVHDFPVSTFAATVHLVPGVNEVTVCQISAVCVARPCTSFDRNGDPLRIIVTAATPTDTPRPTPTPPPAIPCVGDCSGDHVVSVDEIVRMVNIALNGDTTPSSCPGNEQWCTSGPVLGAVGITCLIDAVNNLLTGCPTSPPTPSPTPPTPTGAIRYVLTRGSSILFTAPTPGSAPISAPLSGTFTVFRSQHPPPNTFIGLTIRHVDFRGGSQFVVTDGNPKPNGCAREISLGCIDAVTFDPTHVYVSALVSVNGDDLGLGGGEYLDNPSDLPTFRSLEMCGGPSFQSCDAIRSGTASGYVLSIAAMPEPT